MLFPIFVITGTHLHASLVLAVHAVGTHVGLLVAVAGRVGGSCILVHTLIGRGVTDKFDLLLVSFCSPLVRFLSGFWTRNRFFLVRFFGTLHRADGRRSRLLATLAARGGKGGLCVLGVGGEELVGAGGIEGEVGVGGGGS